LFPITKEPIEFLLLNSPFKPNHELLTCQPLNPLNRALALSILRGILTASPEPAPLN
jgi:hypothetical protein